MLFELALLLIAIPLLLVLIGYFTSSPFPLLIGGIGALVVGVFILASPIYFEQLGNTTEVSHVWNCSNYTDETCFGTPLKNSCWTYNETQCTGIEGCSWDSRQLYCSGTPVATCAELYREWGAEKCYETDGCYIWMESNPQTCDNYITTYEYTQTALDDNENMMVGLLLVFMGLFGLVTGALSTRE